MNTASSTRVTLCSLHQHLRWQKAFWRRHEGACAPLECTYNSWGDPLCATSAVRNKPRTSSLITTSGRLEATRTFTCGGLHSSSLGMLVLVVDSLDRQCSTDWRFPKKRLGGTWPACFLFPTVHFTGCVQHSGYYCSQEITCVSACNSCTVNSVKVLGHGRTFLWPHSAGGIERPQPIITFQSPPL